MDARTKNLTLASAKHLLTQGHITRPHHDRIVKAVSAAPPAAAARAPMRPPMSMGPPQAGMLSGLSAPSAAPAMAPQPEED